MGALLSRPSDWTLPTTYDEALRYSNNLDKYRILRNDTQCVQILQSEGLAFVVDMQWQHEIIRLCCLDELHRVKEVQEDTSCDPDYSSMALTNILGGFPICIEMCGLEILTQFCFLPIFVHCGNPCVFWKDLAKVFPGLQHCFVVRISNDPLWVVFYWNRQHGCSKFYLETDFLFRFDGKPVQFRLNLLNDFTVSQVKTNLGETLSSLLPSPLIGIVNDFVGVSSVEAVW